MTVTFSSLGVPRPLADRLARDGITVPTPIQAATLGDILAGHDVCGEAPTGSGKTYAFGLGVIAAVTKARPHAPRALVLAPTRELANQIARALAPLAAVTDARVAAVYGGVSFGPQVKALQRGVEILVACPGRLEDLISQSVIDLSEVDVFVIDEADRLADMGFLPAVERLLRATPPTRQTMLFSATLDGAVKPIVRGYLHEPRRHSIAKTEVDIARTTQLFWSTTTEDRKDTCADIAAKAGRTIVFTKTKRGADRLARQLTDRGVKAAALHGDRSQAQREAALASFRDNVVTVLVATDVAARGIHVDAVSAVIQFDPPANEADYTHRAGRTGRAGAEGVVVTLAAPGPTRDAVHALQRALGLPKGLTKPDLDLIPEGPVLPEPVKRPVEPARERSGRPQDRPNRAGKNARSARDRYEPARGRSTPERDRSEPARDRTAPPRDRSAEPTRSHAAPERVRSEPSRDRQAPPRERSEAGRDRQAPARERSEGFQGRSEPARGFSERARNQSTSTATSTARRSEATPGRPGAVRAQRSATVAPTGPSTSPRSRPTPSSGPNAAPEPRRKSGRPGSSQRRKQRLGQSPS